MKEATFLFIHTKSTHLKDEMMEMQKIKKENCFMEILSDFSRALISSFNFCNSGS